MADRTAKSRRGQGPTQRGRKAAREESAPTEVAPADRADAPASDTTTATFPTQASARIATTDLNRNLGQVLEAVGSGHTVTLTRYGTPVAHIVPPNVTLTSSIEFATQADAPIAGSPQIRPAQKVDPMQAQRRRDALLGKINTSKRRG